MSVSSSLAAAARRPENYLWALLLAGFAAELARHPLDGWDGRSVWLFAAKRVLFHGMLWQADARWPPFSFSHPEYPLLFASWAALFCRMAGAFNERLVGVSIAALDLPLMALLWSLARSRLGRFTGAVLAAAVAAAAWGWSALGYQDGTLLLLLTALALARLDRDASLSGSFAGAASLLKQEGLLLAPLIWIAIAMARPAESLRARLRSAASEAVQVVPWIAPGVAWVAWARWNGLPNHYGGIRWAEALSHAGARSLAIAQYLWAHFRGAPFFRDACIAALCAAAVAASRRGRLRSPDARPLSFAAAACFAAMAGVFLVTPSHLEWHMANAAHRVFLHGAALLLAGALSALAANGAP